MTKVTQYSQHHPLPLHSIQKIPFVMKKILFLLPAVLFFFFQNIQAQSNIDLAKTEQLLKSDKTIQLVDLRTPGEIQRTGIIAGAKVINYNSPDFKQQMSKLDKNRPVLMYCASGGRSGAALSIVHGLGFKTVYNYTGGMSEWKGKGKPTVMQ